MADFTNPEDNKALLYDLRQIYAIDILRPWLVAINEACLNEDYPAWFKGLKNLKTKADKNFEKKERDALKIKYEELINTINENDDAYLGRSNDPQERGAIEDALRGYEELLMQYMQDEGMFGKGFEYDEDEI